MRLLKVGSQSWRIYERGGQRAYDGELVDEHQLGPEKVDALGEVVDVASGVRLRDDALRVDDHRALLRDVVPMVHERPAKPVGLARVVHAHALVLGQEDVLPTLEVVADVLPVDERVARVIRLVAEKVGVAIVRLLVEVERGRILPCVLLKPALSQRIELSPPI